MFLSQPYIPVKPLVAQLMTGYRDAMIKDMPPMLLVEDNPADVDLVHQSLRANGVVPHIFVAQDGAEAIKLIEAIEESRIPCPALVILDINLPKVLGFDVLKRIRASTACANVPVAVLTSSNSRQDRELAEQLGANAYIVKAGDLRELAGVGAKLKNLLDTEQTSSASGA